MKLARFIGFLAQSISLGLALAFVIVLLRPELLPSLRPVVELRQSAAPAPEAGTPLPSYTRAVEAAAPSVVGIHTGGPEPALPLQPPHQGGLPYPFGKRGSGVVVSSQGHVLTSYHVVAAGGPIRLTLRDGRSTAARLIGADPDTDLAVLQAELADLPAITLGRSGGLRIGDLVLAIGNPYGPGQTVSLGIVGATGGGGLGLNTVEDLIRTDATVDPGNVGGALVNVQGELVGINTALYGGGPRGFAIPADLAREVFTQIVQQGRVIRGWLGLDVQNLTPRLAGSFGLEDTRGVVVTRVEGPARQAGLRSGDILLRMDERPVNDARTLLNRIATYRPGTRLRLSGLRQGDRFVVNPVVGRRPADRPGAYRHWRQGS